MGDLGQRIESLGVSGIRIGRRLRLGQCLAAFGCEPVDPTMRHSGRIPVAGQMPHILKVFDGAGDRPFLIA